MMQPKVCFMKKNSKETHEDAEFNSKDVQIPKLSQKSARFSETQNMRRIRR